MGKLILKINGKSHYPEDKDIRQLTSYIDGKGCNRDRENVIFTGSGGVKPECREAAGQLIKVQRAFGKDNGRRAYHMVVSFEENFRNPDVVIQASKAIGEEIFQKYQVFYGVHSSTDNLHAHFAINAVSYMDGKKWHMSRPELQAFKEKLLRAVNDVMCANNLPPLTLSDN